VVTAKGTRLVPEDFFGPAATTSAETDLRSVGRSAAQQAERARILEVLLQASGNRVKAARLLKISRASLYNKLRAYRIE
jgi:two-component system response regulator AtoC